MKSTERHTNEMDRVLLCGIGLLEWIEQAGQYEHQRHDLGLVHRTKKRVVNNCATVVHNWMKVQRIHVRRNCCLHQWNFLDPTKFVRFFAKVVDRCIALRALGIQY